MVKRMFQSARPVKGATKAMDSTKTKEKVSIRAPREGRDKPVTGRKPDYEVFQSARPVKGATRSEWASS